MNLGSQPRGGRRLMYRFETATLIFLYLFLVIFTFFCQLPSYFFVYIRKCHYFFIIVFFIPRFCKLKI